MQNPTQPRMPYGPTDKELSDLLDFSAMFSPPTGVVGPKNGVHAVTSHPSVDGRTLQRPHYKTGMEEGQGSWGSNSHPSPSYDSRGYEGSSYNDHMPDNRMQLNNNMSYSHDMNSNNSSMSSFMGKPIDSSKPYQMPYTMPNREMPPSQAGMSSMANEMPLSSPNSLSPHSKRGSPFPFGYNNSARRPLVPESSRLAGGPTAKRPRGLSAAPVDSPSGSYDPYSQDSPRYTSPKPPTNMYPEFMDGSHGSPDPWSNNGMPPSTGFSSAILNNTSSSYTNVHQRPHEHMGYGHTMSPGSHETISMRPSLPPISSFHGNPTSGSTPYTSNTSPLNGSESIMRGRSSTGPASSGGGAGGGSQTGDALGQALASIYQPDQTNNSYPSNTSTPVGSPAPMSAGQWTRPSSQASPGPYVESHLHSLQSRMEERLDDAINVLRNHAGEVSYGNMSIIGSGGMGGSQHHPTHPNGAMESHMTYHNQYDPMVQAHMPGPPSHGHQPHQPMSDEVPSPHSRLRNSVPVGGSATTPDIAQPQQPFNEKFTRKPLIPDNPNTDHSMTTYHQLPSPGSESLHLLSTLKNLQHSFQAVQNEMLGQNGSPSQGIKIEKIDQDKNDKSKEKSNKDGKQEHSDGSMVSGQPGGRSKKSRMDDFDVHEKMGAEKRKPPEDEPPEVRAVREKERRHANNARERIRVRDINEAFKELGRMCALHLKSDKAQTKLVILHQAVSVITSLEQQVRERNLNPKAACLKRREEEKVEELPNRAITGPPPPGGDQGALGGTDRTGTKRTATGIPIMHSTTETFSGCDLFGTPADSLGVGEQFSFQTANIGLSPVSPSSSQSSSATFSSTTLKHTIPMDQFNEETPEDSLVESQSSPVPVQ
uniref:Transcription factor 12-like protein isoform X2 n=1 Tax=Saccoglossus kowalevskii TaxID=10224 RepID=A0ABM0LWH1_SACKO|nr:PREDICTED: transcription factor 12-like protein isoform X2 [Saccoglossus kowalevskii]